MKVISFFLCNQVALHTPGGYDIFGYWGENQRVVSLPLNATLVAFLHLVFEDAESGGHALTVKVTDPNKNILTMAHAPVTIQKANPELVLPIVLGPLTITNVGRHNLALEIDQQERANRTISVELVRS